MDFKEKVQSMTGREIVETMIAAIEEPQIEIDMETFLSFRQSILFDEDSPIKCVACAATNMLLRLTGWQFTGKSVEEFGDGKGQFAGQRFISIFENAINSLRIGFISDYNTSAEDIGMATLPYPVEKLPVLSTASYKDNLQAYKDYAATLP